MRVFRTGPALALGGLSILLLAGCSSETASSATPATAASSVSDDLPDVLATIGDEEITMAQVRARIGDQLDQMEMTYRRQRSKAIGEALDGILRDEVLVAEARKQDKSVDQLILDEAGGTLDPSDVEVAAWYDENQARTGGRSLDQIRSQIANFLRDQRRANAMESLQARLNDERGVVVHFEPFRAAFDNDEAAVLGPDDAPVTLVEFSDFECPYCGGFFPTIKRLEENYGEQLRIVYRHFPLSNLHPNAFKAAEASLCAQEQDRFWEFHDMLFQDQQRLAVRDLKEKAGRLGLDQGDFDACIDSGRYVEQVQDDMREGRRYGVNGTPALFVNGIPIDGGAVAYEVVAGVIDQELARAEQ